MVLSWSAASGWQSVDSPVPGAQIVLVFGNREWFSDPGPIEALRRLHPTADVMGCSTGGQIIGDDVSDDCAIALVIEFHKSRVRVAKVDTLLEPSARTAGEALARSLAAPDLRAIIVVSDGLNVNATRMVEGMRAAASVPIMGGLAGDGPHFGRTVVHVNGVSRDHLIVAAGLYGDALQIGHGSSGGWSVFGPRRQITRSDANVLHELDGRSALELYRTYLGEEAEGLPGTGLLYPLMITDPDDANRTLVRTLLSIDDVSGSITFAGDMPEGWRVQLMRGYFDRLARASGEAASQARKGLAAGNGDSAALLISCIGRRILMGDSVISELIAVREELGPYIKVAGFYSYGEIAPYGRSACSELHNQTMTVTVLSESA